MGLRFFFCFWKQDSLVRFVTIGSIKDGLPVYFKLSLPWRDCWDELAGKSCEKRAGNKLVGTDGDLFKLISIYFRFWWKWAVPFSLVATKSSSFDA